MLLVKVSYYFGLLEYRKQARFANIRAAVLSKRALVENLKLLAENGGNRENTVDRDFPRIDGEIAFIAYD